MYVDYDYYDETFKGESVDPADFPSLCERAGELIEELTLYRLTPVTFLAMPENIQNLVKKAVCAQIEYLDANGGADLDNGEEFRVQPLENSVIQEALGQMEVQNSPDSLREPKGYFGQPG